MDWLHNLLWIALAAIVFLAIGHSVASLLLWQGKRRGLSTSDLAVEFELRKNVFVVLGGVSFIVAAGFSFYELALFGTS